MKSIRTWFLSGISVILPIGLTIFVLAKLFSFIDGILRVFVVEAFGHVIPGIGVLLVVLIVLLVGMFTSNFLGKKIVHHFEKVVGKMPLIKIIFNPLREIVKNLSSSKSGSFKKVVIIDFPMQGVKSIGFVTSNDLALNNKAKLSVFIPTTPNPTNGFLVIVENKDVEVLDITVEEGLKMIISMGSVMNQNINTTAYDMTSQENTESPSETSKNNKEEEA